MATNNNNKDDFTNMVAVPIDNDKHLVKKKKKVTFADENLANQLKNALNDHKMQQFAKEITEATQQFEETRSNSFNQQSTQRSQNEEISTSKKAFKIKNPFAKSNKKKSKNEEISKTADISSPIINTGSKDSEFITIQHQTEKREGKVHDGNFNFPKEQLHSFVFGEESKSEDILSSTLFNSTDQESCKNSSRASILSSFSSNSFEFIKPESDITSNKLENKRSVSIDSGISSLADASNISNSNESLASTISQDSGFADSENSVDQKAEVIKFAAIGRTRTNSKLKKVAMPTVPTLKPITSDLGIQKSVNPIEEKKTSLVEDQKSPKEKLLSKIDEFIPKVNVSRRKTIGGKIKYNNLDNLKIEAGKLDLKIKAIDLLLKNKPLMKMDENNNNIPLTTKKDVPLLKELKRDLKKELYKANKEQSQEEKRISIYDKQEQKRLHNKVLKNDVEKIREIISTAKLQTSMEKRFDLLSKLQIDLESAYSHFGKKLDSSLQEVMQELHKEKWAAATNDKLDELLFDHAALTFEDKKAIYESKRFYAGQLRLELASPGQQKCTDEDKKVLKELYDFYEKLAKSSENKPQDLDNAFNREFGPTYKQVQQDLEKEFMEKVCSLLEVKESKVPETKMSEIETEQVIPLTVQNRQ